MNPAACYKPEASIGKETLRTDKHCGAKLNAGAKAERGLDA
jgi:hypothetical protein